VSLAPDRGAANAFYQTFFGIKAQFSFFRNIAATSRENLGATTPTSDTHKGIVTNSFFSLITCVITGAGFK
jgi:hypothetical protein